MVLPRSMRKAFARLTGLHGFFSGKKSKPNKTAPPTQPAPTTKQKPVEAKPKPKPKSSPSKKEEQRVAPAPRDEESKASPNDDGGESAAPGRAEEPPPETETETKPDAGVGPDSDDAPQTQTSKTPARRPQPKKNASGRRAQPPSSALQASFLASAAKLGVDPAALAQQRHTTPKSNSGASTRRLNDASAASFEDPGDDATPAATDVASSAPQEEQPRQHPDPPKKPVTATPTFNKREKQQTEEKVDDALARIDAARTNATKRAEPKPRAPASVEALFQAVERRDGARVDKLLKSTPVDSRDPRLDNYTALFIAAEDGDPSMVDRLIEAGADVEARDNKGRSPLFAAAVIGQAKIVEHLILKHHANPDVRDRQGHHVFWAACAVRQLATAAAILDASARRGVWTVDLNAKDPKSKLNALDWATARQNKDVVDFLTERGAVASRHGNVKHSAIQYELLELDNILNQP